MKLTSSSAEKLLEKVESLPKCLLCYGGNYLSVDEFVLKIKKKLNGKLSIVDVDSDDKSYLTEADAQISTQSMFDVGTLVCIHNFKKIDYRKIAELLNKIDDKSENVVVITHDGNLEATNSIRKLCEEKPHFASISFFDEPYAAVKERVLKTLKQHNLQASDEAISFMVDVFFGRTCLIDGEISKAELFFANESEKLITKDLAIKLFGSDVGVNVFELPAKIFNSDGLTCLKMINHVQEQGVDVNIVLATISNYVKKVYALKKGLDSGETFDILQKKLQIHFSEASIIKKHVEKTDFKKLKKIASTVIKTEVQSRRGMNSFLALRNLVFEVCF